MLGLLALCQITQQKNAFYIHTLPFLSGGGMSVADTGVKRTMAWLLGPAHLEPQPPTGLLSSTEPVFEPACQTKHKGPLGYLAY
jgi:hypothetical protein